MEENHKEKQQAGWEEQEIRSSIHPGKVDTHPENQTLLKKLIHSMVEEEEARPAPIVLTEDITAEDSDEPETLDAGPMNRKDRDYLREEARELRYLDEMLDDSIQNGDEAAAQFWSEQYNRQKSGMEAYMDKRRIRYRLTRNQDVAKDVRAAKEVKQTKEPNREDGGCRTEKKVIVKRARESRGRTLERYKSE